MRASGTPEIIVNKNKELSKEKTDFNKFLFQRSPAFFMSINADGRTMFMSEEMLQLLGYSLEEVIGKDYVSVFIPANERERMNEIFRMLGDSHNQVFDENSLIAKDGREVCIKWQWWPVSGPNNEIDFYFGVGSDISEFIRSEETFEDSETRYRILAENLLDVIWTVDMDLRFTYISPSIRTMLGFSAQEILGYPLEKVLIPSSLKIMKEILSEELTVEHRDQKDLYRTRTLELGLKHKDGFTVLTENKMKFINDLNGRPIGILIVTRDINERKRQEEELREKILQTLFDEAPNPIFVTDDSGRYLDSNRAGLDFLRIDKESLLGKEIKDFSPCLLKKEKPGNLPLFHHCTFENDYIVNGKIKTLLLSVVPITLSNRTILFCIGQDVTDRKQAEEAIKEREEKYRLLIENQTDLVVKMDSEKRFLFVSPSYCRLFGKNEKDLLGENFLSFIHEEDREATAQAMQKLCTRPHTCFVIHRALIKSRLIWIEWSLKAIIDKNGNIDTILGGGRDVTQRKKTEQEKESIHAQLLQAQKMEAVGTFAGGIAHDFNNLITVIKGHCQLINRKISTDDPIKENLEEVLQAASSASTMTGQFLAFSRKQMFQLVSMDINSLVSDLKKMIGRLIGEDICLKTIIDECPAFVRVDPTQITQVIMNLSLNARDSMPNGGDLIIKTENVALKKKKKEAISQNQAGKFVCLTVQDTGRGMDKDTLQHIFEPFFTTKGAGEGTGLGLSVVYGIIKQHKGWINVNSEQGKGTTFKIYLPAFPVVIKTKTKGNVSVPEGSGERILLVEDDSSVRKYIKEALMENGYLIFDASLAKEALDIFEQERGNFDLVLSDVVLPEINGLHLIDLLLNRKPDLKVLLTSGYMDKKSQWPVIMERGFPFLQKPYNLNDLFKVVKEVLV
ncbi:MAG: PAS domain S-box protein [bacterium]